MKFETCDEHEKEEYQKTSKYGLVGISKASWSNTEKEAKAQKKKNNSWVL
jgi:hypothetical protein